VLFGLASVATIPVAVYLTRFSDSYDLLHAGFAIPIAGVLALVALALARRARQRSALRLASSGPSGSAVAGRVLGIAGLCVALAAVVSLAVYGLLEYWASRD
jgi:hypothetical protein